MNKSIELAKRRLRRAFDHVQKNQEARDTEGIIDALIEGILEIVKAQQVEDLQKQSTNFEKAVEEAIKQPDAPSEITEG